MLESTTCKYFRTMGRYLTIKQWAAFGLGLALAFPQVAEARSVQSCNRSDSTELVNFYMATNGAKWITSRPAWDFKKPVATWGGVSLRNSRVTAISLNNSNLTGKLPALNLPELEKLELGLNALSGPVPSFAGCPKLRVLYLASNKLECDYQSINFEQTPHLVKLDLSLNKLYGNFKEPAIYKLKELNLASNQLSGSLPSLRTIGGSLEVLNLSNNRLTGYFPVMAAANVLQVLNVSHNQLQGNLPASLNVMFKNLSVLDISHNKFYGYVPDFNGFNKLSDLLLGHNEFSGITNLNMLCPKLRVLDLSHNKFSGGIPIFSSLPLLEVLDITYNSFNFDNAEKIPVGFSGLKFSPQNPISIEKAGNQLLVNAGYNSQNHTFTWYEGKQEKRFIANANSSSLITFAPAFYSCQVRHKTNNNLRLETEGFYFEPMATDVVASKSFEKSGESVVRGVSASRMVVYKRGSNMPIRVQQKGKHTVTVYNDKQVEEWKEPHNVSDTKVVSLKLKMASPGVYRVKVVGPNSFKQFIDIEVK